MTSKFFIRVHQRPSVVTLHQSLYVAVILRAKKILCKTFQVVSNFLCEPFPFCESVFASSPKATRTLPLVPKENLSN